MSKSAAQVFHVLLHGRGRKERFQFYKQRPLDPHGRVPPPLVALVAPDAVAKALDRLPADVLDSCLPSQKLVAPRSRQQNEKLPEPQILNIPKSPFLSSPADELRAVDPVSVDKLRIDRSRIFVWWDVADDVKPVAVGHIRHGQLLNEPGDTRCFTPIHASLPQLKDWELYCGTSSRKPGSSKQHTRCTTPALPQNL